MKTSEQKARHAANQRAYLERNPKAKEKQRTYYQQRKNELESLRAENKRLRKLLES